MVSAIWTGEFIFKRERDRIYHTQEMKGDLVLTGTDFALINDLVNSCERVTVTVETYCGGDWVAYDWTGYFTKFDTRRDFGGINHAQCRLEAKIKTDDLYDCVSQEWEDELNIYSASSVIQTKSLKGTYEILGVCAFCSVTPIVAPCDDFGVSDESCLEFQSATQDTDNCNPGEFYIVCSYHRVVGVGTPTTPPTYSTGWTYISGNNWWRCPGDEEIDIGVLRYGRRFDAILQYLVTQTGCGLTVRSHFFDIAATHAAPPSNDAYTFATGNLQDLTIHQKSDVKRPDATNASFAPPTSSAVWKMKLKELLEDLTTMFNVFWKIDGTSLIIEHASYFQSAAGEDYTAQPMKLQLDYDTDIPKSEVFKWSDANVSANFTGYPITYDCGNGIKERKVRLFTTDLPFIREEANQEAISDENWVLIANQIIDTEYIIIDTNDPLRWTSLHDKLHRHYRPFETGTLNNVAATFLSTQKIQKQPPFTVGMCCDAVFDPNKYITTALGQGDVREATRNLKKDRIELELNY